MPHIEESRHRGQSRSAPSVFCTWKGFHPNVLGALVIRLSQLGYGVLFGTTSDGGRLTLSCYMGEVRRTAYLKKDASPDTLFSEVARVLGLDSRAVVAPIRPHGAFTAKPLPPAASGANTAGRKADRLFEERQDKLQIQAMRYLIGRTPDTFDIVPKSDTII